MIINLNLQNRKVCIVGGGTESLKRISPLLQENCKIIVISEKFNRKISNLATKKKIQLKKRRLKDAEFLQKENPFLVITTTNNNELNSMILQKAKKMKIISYSSDNPEQSNFANPAIINFEKIIKVAIFTGGKSPIMSKKIRDKVETSLKKTIKREDIEQIKIQEVARKLVKKRIGDHKKRKELLDNFTRDKKIKQLIKERQKKKIENRIYELMRSENESKDN